MSPTGTPNPAPEPVAQPAPAHTAPPARALPGHGESHRHVLVAIVLNKPGVLNRVASLMRARTSTSRPWRSVTLTNRKSAA